MSDKNQRRDKSLLPKEQREAIEQGATPDRTDRNFTPQGHGTDEIVGTGGTGGTSGTAGERSKVDTPGDESGISGASERTNIDRKTGRDYTEAMESPDASRAGKTRKQEIEEQNK